MKPLFLLMTGTLGSQLVLFGAMAFSVLLYSPEQIGEYGVVLSFIYFLSHFSGLRIDGLIVAKPLDAIELIGFGKRIVVIQTGLLFFTCLVWSLSIMIALIASCIFYWYSLMLLHSTILLQQRQIHLITRAKISSALITAFSQFAAFFLPIGLLLGDAIGKWFHSRQTTIHVSTKQVGWPSLSKESKYALLQLNGTTLGTAICTYSPLILVDLFYGHAQAAHFFLALRFSGFVEQLLGYSSHQWVISETHDSRKFKKTKRLLVVVGLTLLLYSCMIAALSSLVQFDSLQYWKPVVALVIVLIPYGLLQTMLIPVRTYLMQHQQWTLLCYGESGRALAILICAFSFRGFELHDWVTAVSLGGAYVSLLVYLIYTSALAEN